MLARRWRAPRPTTFRSGGYRFRNLVLTRQGVWDRLTLSQLHLHPLNAAPSWSAVINLRTGQVVISDFLRQQRIREARRFGAKDLEERPVDRGGMVVLPLTVLSDLPQAAICEKIIHNLERLADDRQQCAAATEPADATGWNRALVRLHVGHFLRGRYADRQTATTYDDTSVGLDLPDLGMPLLAEAAARLATGFGLPSMLLRDHPARTTYLGHPEI